MFHHPAPAVYKTTGRSGCTPAEPYPPDGQRILALRSEFTKTRIGLHCPPRLLVAAKAKNSTTNRRAASSHCI